jgi:hypothetical protein
MGVASFDVRDVAMGGLRSGPDGPPGEVMVAERGRAEAALIRAVDGGKSVHAVNATEPTAAPKRI